MKISKIALAVCATLIFGMSSVFAGDPKPKPSDCSPGYWKNHTDVWDEFAGTNFAMYLEELQARGPGSRERREAIQAILNAEFEAGTACEEDD